MTRRTRYCVGCGALAPPRSTEHGWTTTHMAAKGKGQRWYKQCGCLSSLAYYELTERLFDADRNYPHRLKGRNS